MLADMPERKLSRADLALLAASLACGTAAALRIWGAAALTFPAAALLAAATALALRPLLRLFGGGPLEPRRRAVLAVLFGAHLVATLFFFPPEDILNDRPVLTLDHSLHLYQAERAKEIFWSTGRLHTYDPYFMAGYPGGTIFDIDSKGVELWCALLRFLDTAVSYKLFVILGHLLLVFTVYAGCRRLRFHFEESIIAVLLLLAFWHWGRPYAGHFRFAGMFSYLIVCHLSLYLAGLMRSFLDEEPVKRFYVLGPLACFIHPTAAVLLPVPLVALFLAARRRVPAGAERRAWYRRVAARHALWCLLVLAVNAVWLVPLFRYIDIKIASDSFFQIRGFGALAGALAKPGNFMAPAVVALAAAGIGRLARGRRLADAAAPAAGGAFLLLLSAFGVYIPVFDQMEPGRFLVPALIFLVPLAGAGAATVIEELGKAARSARTASAVRAAALTVLLVASPALSLVSSRAFYRHTISTTLTPAARNLVEELSRRIDRSGRLMIEDGPAWAYGETFLPALLPHYTRVEQIGGPYPFTFIKHSFATFKTCEAFGKPLWETDAGPLREYLDLYNVRWILTATPACAERIEALGFSNGWRSGAFSLWEIAPPAGASFASEPGVEVRASYGRIDVTIAPGDTPPPIRVLLKYHWDRGLRVAPPARISPVMRLDDPVPFILLEPGGESEIRIYFE
jgi:hypothetical protein